MKRKNEKGFALVLSLLLLLVMSLMGGALIVISSTDHQSNNTSDEYQQTFYVAETALLEGEKFIINQMMGPWVVMDTIESEKPVGLSDDEEANWNLMVAQMEANKQQGLSRYVDKRDLPQNRFDPQQTPCYNSFRNINRTGFQVAYHEINKNFGSLIQAVFSDGNLDTLADTDTITREKAHMDRFRYEYFIVNIGSATFRGAGASLKKTTTNTQTSGTAYKIYGCGYMMPKSESKSVDNIDDGFSTEGWAAVQGEDPDILVALETVAVLSN